MTIQRFGMHILFTFVALFSSLSHSKTNQYFDAHIHMGSGYHDEIPYKNDHARKVQEVYEHELNELFNQKDLAGGFLLTPTYYDGWLKEPISNILNENSLIVEELAKKRNDEKRFRVLCGVNIYDPRALEIAEGCLSLKGIAGLKIRFMPMQKLPLVFEKIIDMAGSKKVFLLVHFSGPDKQKGNKFSEETVKGESEQVQKLIELMSSVNQAKLIIAHSGMDRFIGINGLKIIGRYFKKHPEKTRNIYTEISFGFRQAGIHGLADTNYTQLVDAWKEFGIDSVLYGTDSYRRSVERGGLPFLVDFLKSDSIGLSAIPTLNHSEKDKILRENFERFFLE